MCSPRAPSSRQQEAGSGEQHPTNLITPPSICPLSMKPSVELSDGQAATAQDTAATTPPTAASCPASHSGTPYSARLSPSGMPVVRLFAKSPSSRLRPSSPLRTSVTLNIQRSPPGGSLHARHMPVCDGPSRSTGAPSPGSGETGTPPASATLRSRIAKENLAAGPGETALDRALRSAAAVADAAHPAAQCPHTPSSEQVPMPFHATALSRQPHAAATPARRDSAEQPSMSVQGSTRDSARATVTFPGPPPHAASPSGVDWADPTSERPWEPTPEYSPMQISPAPPSTTPGISGLAAKAQRRRPVSAAAAEPRTRFGPPGAAAGSPPAGVGSARVLGPATGEPRRPASSGGAAQGLESVAALELLGDCAAAEAAAARRARGVDPLLVRDALRASIKEAARAAASSASKGGASAAAAGAQAAPPDRSPRGGSGLLWSLLRNSLRQQGEALIDLHTSRAAARGAQQQLLKAQAGEREAAEQALKAQALSREVRAQAKRHAAACEAHKAHQARRIEELEGREQELVEGLSSMRTAAEELGQARMDAAQARTALGEVMAARRGAREALAEMAAQNARLVVGYCAKKAELRRLQEGLAAERARWQVRLDKVEAEQYASAQGSGSSSSSDEAPSCADGTDSLCGSGSTGAPPVLPDVLQTRLDEQGLGWKAERARLHRDKAALQRECRALLDRLHLFQSTTARAVLEDMKSAEDGAQQERMAAIEAQIQRLTEENATLRREHAEAERRSSAAELRERIDSHKQAGNSHFQHGRHMEAVQEYTTALGLAQQLPDQAALQAVLHSNRAAVLHALGRHMDALADCYAAVSLDPGYLRAYQRRADIFAAVGDRLSAAQDLALLAAKGVAGAAKQLTACQSAARVDEELDHYAVLGVQHSAAVGDVRSAFRQLALKYHPDKASGPGRADAADKLFQLISCAHSVLSSPAQRRRYDIVRLQRHTQAGSRRVG